jgi:hypothetical protein
MYAGIEGANAAFVEGERLLAARQITQARSCFQQAQRLGGPFDPIAARLWHCAMLLGRFEDAWRISDAVLADRQRRGLNCRELPLHLQWVWDGTPLRRRDVSVRCHHGLGDVIQFVRLLAMLRPVARTIHLQAPPALLPLLADFPHLDRLSSMEEQPSLPDHAPVELLELPHALRLQFDEIPSEVPYLRRRRPHPREDQLRVGLVWAAGVWKPDRTVPLEMLARLARVSGVRFVCLQRGPALAELENGSDPLRLRRTGQGTDDLLPTLEALRSIDLVISVDTMMAHLAGAIGMPVWTMLHFDADWRWLAAGESSPWYPTMRLFRQRSPGDWAPVVERLEAELGRAAGR